MKRTDLLDTSLEVHKARIKMLRQLSPSQRLRKTIELSDDLRLIRETTRQYRPKSGE